MLINQPRVLTLVEKIQRSPRSWELCYLSEEEMRHLPGQFYSFQFPTDQGSKARSYSVVNRIEAGADAKELRFIITMIPEGAASLYFYNAEIGSSVEVSGPFGNLVLPKVDPQRYVLIATGAGVAPYRSMLPQLSQRLNQNSSLKVELLLGVPRQSELIYADEFIDMASSFDGFSFQAFYSQESYVADPEFERLGYVQTGFDQLQADPEKDKVYLCGHPEMVEQSVDYFEALGFSAANLKREKYLFSSL